MFCGGCVCLLAVGVCLVVVDICVVVVDMFCSD